MELAGIAAIVASLYFVAVQLKVSQDIAQSEVAAAHNAALVELNNGINDHAGIWAKGNAGRDLDETELVIFRGLLEGIEEYHRLEWRHEIRFDQGDSLTSETEGFAIFLHNNPGARKIWASDWEAYHVSRRVLDPSYGQNRFYEQVVGSLKKLDEQP